MAKLYGTPALSWKGAETCWWTRTCDVGPSKNWETLFMIVGEMTYEDLEGDAIVPDGIKSFFGWRGVLR